MPRAGGLAIASLAAACVAAACTAFSSSDAPVPTVSDAGGDGATVVPPPPPPADAGDGGACADPVPAQEDFADVGTAPKNLVATATHLYWLAAGRVQRRPFDLGPTETVIDPASFPGDPATSAFVVANGYVAAVMGSLCAVPDQADAGSKTNIQGSAPLASNGTLAFSMYGGIYYMKSAPPTAQGIFGTLPTGALELATNTTDTPYALAPAPDDAGVNNVVYKLQVTTPDLVFSGPRNPSRIAVDGTEIFMTETDTGDVFKAPLDGSGVVTVLAPARKGLGDIAVRLKTVYYATSSGIRSMPAQGGCERANTDVPTDAFAVTDSHVYYATGTKIRRAPLPP